CVGQAMGMGMDQASAAAYCESAGYSSGLQAQMSTPGSSGTVMGFDMNGTASIPAGYPGDGGAEGNLLAVIVLNSQYSGAGAEVAVTISDFYVSGINPFTGEDVALAACDADLNPLNGCFDVDTFATPQADCAGIPAGSAAVDECGDCWGGNTGNSENYMDTDGDGVCNDGAANGDDDNCPDTPNTDQADNDSDEAGDLCDDDDDNDGCDDDVDDDQMNYDDDYDADGTPDDCDGDDDNDGAADGVDSDDNNENVCNDDDGDTCDECTNGSYDSANDGWDYDGDGACDDGDDDDDNDGALD
ncbi:uncharacterized protein METZ01_LOCUS376274, partial [marine metagenome]